MISDYVAYWPMDELTGNVKDISPNNNLGTVTGTTSVQGRKGMARSLLGSASHKIIVSDSTSLRLPNNSSFSFWIYLNAAVGGTYQSIILKNLAPGDASYQLYLEATTGNFNFYNNISGFSPSGVPCPVQTWTHVVALANGASGKWYFNAIETTTVTMRCGTYDASNLDIGHNQSSTNFLNAALDDVRFYNRILTAGEIHQLFIFSAAKFNNSGIRPRPFAPCLAR